MVCFFSTGGPPLAMILSFSDLVSFCVLCKHPSRTRLQKLDKILHKPQNPSPTLRRIQANEGPIDNLIRRPHVCKSQHPVFLCTDVDVCQRCTSNGSVFLSRLVVKQPPLRSSEKGLDIILITCLLIWFYITTYSLVK